DRGVAPAGEREAAVVQEHDAVDLTVGPRVYAHRLDARRGVAEDLAGPERADEDAARADGRAVGSAEVGAGRARRGDAAGAEHEAVDGLGARRLERWAEARVGHVDAAARPDREVVEERGRAFHADPLDRLTGLAVEDADTVDVGDEQAVAAYRH